mmetsp:Transcript_10978/g.27734  ORF Transcript_10978/g.27734 Transcript_10978/m.27734 type:complete len:521 (-) Transcript_10978:37-1599(-)|eukprot:CAMPEP_0177640618 /NCGR_PEP_ID=MMETSP0447-20121125/6638_1 /TAXON_ID=0 /ORGANISM="Stygamoeba regulata, Strain BSH-02190019" /LENGTH=520 /DNA_ID=CAMNT_0019142699 /DNA_START=64 /DNA_END=1626 /DNA_ORIENTATION=-
MRNKGFAGALAFLHSPPVAYGATSFAAAALHNIFITYYVLLFLSVYEMDEQSFYQAQVIFMLWNSVNDPLAGWWLDLASPGARLGRKLTAISVGGALWALSFLLLFFPPPSFLPLGLFFFISLCLYDTFFSLVLVAHASLLPDLALSTVDRTVCNSYSSAGSLIGSSSVFFSHIFWKGTNLTNFRIYLVVVVAVALYSFGVITKGVIGKDKRVGADCSEKEACKAGPHPSLATMLGQLLRHRNFLIFVAINFIQVLNCHFNSNFLTLFVMYFVGPHRGALLVPLILTAVSLMPHALVLALARHIPARGLHWVVAALFRIKLAIAVGGWLAGYAHWWLVVLFIVLNKVFNEAICRHGNLVVADLVDEDMALNSRRVSASSVVYGVNAFFTKPGQSIAPMSGWFLLRALSVSVEQQAGVAGAGVSGVQADPGGETIVDAFARWVASFSGGVEMPAESTNTDVMSMGRPEAVFAVMVFVPFLCAVCQMALWSLFDLKGDKLKKVRLLRRNLEVDADACSLEAQ